MAETQEQELLSKRIKHNVENWREIILPVYDVLVWKKIPLYPGIVFGITTTVFIFILLLDPTVLSFISSVCLLLVILDYITPIIITKLYNPDSWNGPKERKLEEICSRIANAYISMRLEISYFCSWKDSNPKMYYSILICGLLFLSWLGNSVNNVFLTYLFVTYMLMLPGLKHSGYFKKFESLIRQYLAKVLRSVSSQKRKKQ